MSIQFGKSGYGWDVVNGIQKTGSLGTDGMPLSTKTPNRARFARHKTDNRNFDIFWGCIGTSVVMAAVLHWFVPAVALFVGALYWAVWSTNTGEELYCEPDPATGLMMPVDSRAEMLLQYGDYFRPFVDRENRLLDILVSAKTMPPEMNDETMRWECVEFDDAKTVFEIRTLPVNGMVSFFQTNMKDIAAMFGDPDRWDFHKLRDDEKDPKRAAADMAEGVTAWQLTVYELPKNIRAGVAWE